MKDILDEFTQAMALGGKMEEWAQRHMRAMTVVSRVFEALHWNQDKEGLQRIGITQDGEGFLVSWKGEVFTFYVERAPLPQLGDGPSDSEE